MQEDPQAAEHRKRMGLPAGIDLKNLDPRKAVDAAALERVIRAQEMARAQAQAATTVVIGTVVTLVSSAFGFVAALAWNNAIQKVLAYVFKSLGWDKQFGPTKEAVFTAIVFTVVAIIAIVVLQRVAGRWAKKAAINASGGI